MASIIHAQVMHRTDARIDDLCPTCHNPSLVLVRFFRISLEGVTPVASKIACTDCKVWTSPTKKEPTT